VNPFALAEQLPDDTAALQALAARQRDRIAALEQQLATVTEQYRLAQHRRFGAARETSSSQLELFAALCAAAQQAASDATALADLSV